MLPSIKSLGLSGKGYNLEFREKNIFYIKTLDNEFNLDKNLFELSNDDNYNFRLHTLRDFVFSFMNKYTKTNKLEYINYLKKLIFQYISKYNKIEKFDHSKKNWQWYDHAVSIRTIVLNYVLLFLRNKKFISDKEIIILETTIVRYCDLYLIDDKNYLSNNHGLYMDLALLISFKYIKHASSKKWREIAIRRFKKNIKNLISVTEGLSLEHSSSYHILYAKLISAFVNCDPEFSVYKLYLENFNKNFGWFFLPNYELTLLGDSDSFLEQADKFILTGVEDVKGYQVFEKAGFGFIRLDNSYISVTNCYHNQFHKHIDECSFEWYDRNHKIIVDTGRFTYNQKERSNCSSAEAHNSVIISHSTQSAPSGPGFIDINYEPESELFKIGLINKRHESHSIKHQRKMIYKPLENLEIWDTFFSLSDFEGKLHFHLDPSFNQIKKINSDTMEICSSKLKILFKISDAVNLDYIESEYYPKLNIKQNNYCIVVNFKKNQRKYILKSEFSLL